jgi:hypothetical protein
MLAGRCEGLALILLGREDGRSQCWSRGREIQVGRWDCCTFPEGFSRCILGMFFRQRMMRDTFLDLFDSTRNSLSGWIFQALLLVRGRITHSTVKPLTDYGFVVTTVNRVRGLLCRIQIGQTDILRQILFVSKYTSGSPKASSQSGQVLESVNNLFALGQSRKTDKPVNTKDMAAIGNDSLRSQDCSTSKRIAT